MDFDLKRPCANCPFRSDIMFHLNTDRVEEILDGILYQDATFACHKTTHGEEVEDDEGNTYYNHTGKEQHCAGALLLMEHMERPNQMMRIAERLRLYKRDELDYTSLVFETDDDMIEAYRERNGDE